MSDDTSERSASGSPILRHAERIASPVMPEHHAVHLEEIEAHVAKHIGPISTVLHEIVSDLVHLDVLVIEATEERPFHTLVTSGVSDLPMAVPDGLEEERRVELLITLPADWPLTMEAFQDERHYWPVRWLKKIGRLPHEYGTWIGWGHTIPNGDPPVPIADTRFAGVLLMPPYFLPADFFRLKTTTGETVTFYQLMALHTDEMDLKLREGADALEALLEKNDVGMVVDPRRPSVVGPTKRGWWPFKAK